MKNERGVTLIALVITIIIMVIVAGLVIKFSASEENGIVIKAKNAVESTKNFEEQSTAERDNLYEEIISPNN